MFNIFKRNKPEETVTNKEQSVDFTEQQCTQLYGLLGGEEKYKRVMRWAATVLNEEYNTKFNDVMEEGDFEGAKAAIEELGRKFETALDADPEGTAEKTQLDRKSSAFEQRLFALLQEFKESASTRDFTNGMKMMLVVTKMEHEDAVNWLNNEPQEDQDIDAWKKDIAKIDAAMELLRDV